MNKKMLAVALVAASAFAGVAQAEGFYAGAELNRVKAADFCDGANQADVSCDDTDNSYRLFGGYDVNENLAFEVGYGDLGEMQAAGSVGDFDGHIAFEARALDFDVIGRLPLSDSFSFYGKAGMAYWDTEVSGAGTYSGEPVSASVSERGLDPLLGLGVEWNVGPVSLRAGAVRMFDIGDANKTGQLDLDVYSVGIKYAFK